MPSEFIVPKVVTREAYADLLEQLETLHGAARRLLESADDQEHPDDGFPLEEWLDLVEAVRASSPAKSPDGAGSLVRSQSDEWTRSSTPPPPPREDSNQERTPDVPGPAKEPE